jgi:hypothetical protein
VSDSVTLPEPVAVPELVEGTDDILLFVSKICILENEKELHRGIAQT